ncbi:TnsA endonuclease N terminal protein [Mycobacteroides abscessus subsp. abscessus]|uniref:TnsA endonuclease N terminal protein n=3 Tax=Mycobacteroides abscessus TaxID=36809 RepID=A0AB74FFL4_9MYCO|nr:TnsA-like heteromeric transposase endonuclease subunit [Mycobacteroides abscessus]EIU37685.1 tnsA endonuclease N terminal domain-containing protein [Mycobacteroides abscessus 6G-0125-S]EIU40333.1 tnsA endonuclease N terminal domain-containing protein [Mycobacteroides abscessus 6G-0125-R]EIU54597.1 tnsA endonuclease N terminal domain-containing protein [Mycobacteroides abscessus 6G-0728-S]EIU96250.1 tnsA endonuclease N terminal domain-containing protein [Mycobacteroides abscessus 6G-0728-R]E
MVSYRYTGLGEPQWSSARVSVRASGGEIVESAASDVHSSMWDKAEPWRTFRWHRGQKHYSGCYWSTTESGFVVYESRLELAHLVRADFDPSVRRIVAQPFLVQIALDSKCRRHVPDYLLFTGDGLVIVDVKPRELLEKPKIAYTLAWMRDVGARMGCSFEVQSEPPAMERLNLRFVAGFRRSESVSAQVLEELRGCNLDGLTIGQAVSCVQHPPPRVRAALLHMVWRHELLIDLGRPMTSQTLITRVAP